MADGVTSDPFLSDPPRDWTRPWKVYTALHADATAANRTVKVGIVKDLFQFHPYRWYNILDHVLAWICDKLFNKVLYVRFLSLDGDLVDER